MYLMGIDVGTTGAKVGVVSEIGELLAEAGETYPIHSPHTNWFEQDPADWWKATVNAIRQVIRNAGIDGSSIRGIGLSGQYHGLVLVDRNQRALRPCIMWNDQRTAQQSEHISRRVGTETLQRIAATGGAPYFTACKLQWVQEKEPDIFEKAYKLLLPKDYIRMKLTGEYVTDVTDASGTLFLDIRQRQWSREILDLLGYERSLLPEVVESPALSGKVTRSAAAEIGIAPGIPVAGGAGDQAAAAVGIGIVDEGYVSYSIGTSGVIYAATENVRIDPKGRVDSFCHSVPGKWCLLACINSAAGSLHWYETTFCEWERYVAGREEKSVYRILEEEASAAAPGSDKLFFLPYLAGERHPHTDPDAKGVFFGLHPGHTKAHIIRSILEGVAFSFRDCLEVLRELGIGIKDIRVTGGGAQSELWKRIMVNVNGEPLRVMQAELGGAAFGAAILGGVCAGVYHTVQEACSRMVRYGDRIVPDPGERQLYDKYFSFYRTLYPVLRGSYKELSAL